MTKRERELFQLALQVYIQTPEGIEFMKKIEDYNRKLDEITSILGVYPKVKRKKKLEFNKVYADFIKTDKGRQYHEYFVTFNEELKELAERLVPSL